MLSSYFPCFACQPCSALSLFLLPNCSGLQFLLHNRHLYVLISINLSSFIFLSPSSNWIALTQNPFSQSWQIFLSWLWKPFTFRFLLYCQLFLCLKWLLLQAHHRILIPDLVTSNPELIAVLSAPLSLYPSEKSTLRAKLFHHLLASFMQSDLRLVELISIPSH